MLFNLDKQLIENISLGATTELEDGHHEVDSYAFVVKKKKIQNIHVRLGEFYSSGPLFDGALVLNGKRLSANMALQPEDIKPHLPKPTSQWNDGTEVNYQFLKVIFVLSLAGK